jgi:hypothetical protein
MSIKAIETFYRGNRFRSRLEARWAVYFDTLGIRYEYESQGFRVGPVYEDGPEWSYLPDFHLIDLGTWVEVKGSLDEVSDDYLEMIAAAVDWDGFLPGVSDSGDSSRGLLWLGPIPGEDRCRAGAPTHVILQHSKGGWVNYCNFFGPRQLEVTESCDHYFDSTWDAPDCAEVIRPILANVVYGAPGYCHLSLPCPERVFLAYRAARQARFEHGEQPTR